MRRGLFLLLAACLLAACFDTDRVAGGGGVEVEGITVEGMAYFPDDKPAAGARVRVRPWDHLAQDTTAAKAGALKTRVDTVTDAAGRFAVASLAPGIYAIEVDAGESGTALMRVEADGSRPVVQVEGTVWAGGTVSGRVRSSAGALLAGVLVGVYGMDRAVATDDSGAFALEGLAPGLYTLKLKAPSDSFAAVDVPDVAVGAGSRVVLDSLVLPPSVSGLRGHWRCDEGKGRVAADAVGDARLILEGAAWGQGRQGHALDLRDRTYAFVPRSRAGSLQIGAGRDFMVTLWFKADPSVGAGTLRILADTRTAYTRLGWMLGLDADGTATFLARQPHADGAAKGDALESRIGAGPRRLDDGNWHHLAVGRRGARYSVYVDGELGAETDIPAGALTEDSPLYIGAGEGKAGFFTGLVDDLRLYDRALTAEETRAVAR